MDEYVGPVVKDGRRAVSAMVIDVENGDGSKSRLVMRESGDVVEITVTTETVGRRVTPRVVWQKIIGAAAVIGGGSILLRLQLLQKHRQDSLIGPEFFQKSAKMEVQVSVQTTDLSNDALGRALLHRSTQQQSKGWHETGGSLGLRNSDDS